MSKLGCPEQPRAKIHVLPKSINKIHKKVVELGLSCAYSGEKAIPEFTTWVRMLMAFPFLILDDIDDV